MPRPAMPIGSHGTVTRTQLAPGRWRASARYRGLDGVTRKVQRDTPPGETDRHGAKAEQALVAAIEEMMSVEGGGDITTGSLMSVVLDQHMADVEKSDLAPRTKDSYRWVASLLRPRLGEIRVGEATTRRLQAIVTGLGKDHGQVVAKQAKTLLMAMGRLLIAEGAWDRNKSRDIEASAPRSAAKKPPARVLSGDEIRALLEALRTSTVMLPPKKGASRSYTTRTVSEFARDVDLLDPIVMLCGTGLRRSELLGLQWPDYDAEKKTITIRNHVIRSGRSGRSTLTLEQGSKTDSSARVIALPGFVTRMLDARRTTAVSVRSDEWDLIFPSGTGPGVLRDPDTFNAQWARIRGEIGFGDVSSHTFRRTAATLADEGGVSTRKISDALGHSRISMTTDVYMGRKQTHPEVADAIDAAVSGE